MASNHFEKFSLTPSFDINLDELEHKYLQLQQKLHPDQLLHKDIAEQDAAIIESINVNEAYKILRNPIKRAIYLLKLQGINIDDDNCPIKPNQETLFSILELREEISKTNEITKINEIKSNLEADIAELMQIVQDDFKVKNLDQAAQNLIKVKYLDKTIADLKLKKQNL